MYFVMNNINDDFAKNTISGLLDFIFNTYFFHFIKEIEKKKGKNTEKLKQLKKKRSDCYKIFKRKISSLIRLKIKKIKLLMIFKKVNSKKQKNLKRTNHLKPFLKKKQKKINHKLQQLSKLRRRKSISKEIKNLLLKVAMVFSEDQVIFLINFRFKEKTQIKIIERFRRYVRPKRISC